VKKVIFHIPLILGNSLFSYGTNIYCFCLKVLVHIPDANEKSRRVNRKEYIAKNQYADHLILENRSIQRPIEPPLQMLPVFE
jgi:hypothetical protein